MAVRFLGRWGVYQRGEVAGFAPAVAARLVSARLADPAPVARPAPVAAVPSAAATKPARRRVTKEG